MGDERRGERSAERDAIAARGWDRFVDGVARRCRIRTTRCSPPASSARFDRLTIAQRVDELDLDDEEHDVLWAELESLAHGPLDEAGAVSVLRWHALSGYSLALTQYTGGRVTLTDGTRGLLHAIAGGGAVRDPSSARRLPRSGEPPTASRWRRGRATSTAAARRSSRCR